MAQLLYVSSDADPDLKVIERAKAAGITATARDSSPAPQRNYARASLERFGPNRWESYDAPALEVQDASSKPVTLADCAAPEKNAATLKELGELPIRLLSDNHFANAHRFHSYDDFEGMELHSTILIDKKGRVYWARVGGDPFSDTAFLMKQLERMNEATERSSSDPSR
jgi:hypothetical protein